MKLFLSHKSEDKPLVREFASHLPSFLRTWLDEKSLVWGEEFPQTIESAIQLETDFLVIFLNQPALDSDWVRRELNWALDHESIVGRQIVLPILMDSVTTDVIPAALQDRLNLRLNDREATSVADLANRASTNIFHLVIDSYATHVESLNKSKSNKLIKKHEREWASLIGNMCFTERDETQRGSIADVRAKIDQLKAQPDSIAIREWLDEEQGGTWQLIFEVCDDLMKIGNVEANLPEPVDVLHLDEGDSYTDAIESVRSRLAVKQWNPPKLEYYRLGLLGITHLLERNSDSEQFTVAENLLHKATEGFDSLNMAERPSLFYSAQSICQRQFAFGEKDIHLATDQLLRSQSYLCRAIEKSSPGVAEKLLRYIVFTNHGDWCGLVYLLFTELKADQRKEFIKRLHDHVSKNAHANDESLFYHVPRTVDDVIPNIFQSGFNALRRARALAQDAKRPLAYLNTVGLGLAHNHAIQQGDSAHLEGGPTDSDQVRYFKTAIAHLKLDRPLSRVMKIVRQDRLIKKWLDGCPALMEVLDEQLVMDGTSNGRGVNFGK